MGRPLFSFTGDTRACFEVARGIQTLFFNIAGRHSDGDSTPALRPKHLSALDRAADAAAKVGVKVVAPPTPEWFHRFFNRPASA